MLLIPEPKGHAAGSERKIARGGHIFSRSFPYSLASHAAQGNGAEDVCIRKWPLRFRDTRDGCMCVVNNDPAVVTKTAAVAREEVTAMQALQQSFALAV